MLIIGLVNTTGIFLYDLIAYNTNPDISGVIIGLKDNINSVGDVFLFILDLLIQCIWNLGFWLTIYYFSPCHTFISDFISNIFFYIKNSIEKDDELYSTKYAVIFSIAYFIVLFLILIYNEVIIVNFLGFDYNTIKRIKEREKTDSDIMNMISLRNLTKEEESEVD